MGYWGRYSWVERIMRGWGDWNWHGDVGEVRWKGCGEMWRGILQMGIIAHCCWFRSLYVVMYIGWICMNHDVLMVCKGGMGWDGIQGNPEWVVGGVVRQGMWAEGEGGEGREMVIVWREKGEKGIRSPELNAGWVGECGGGIWPDGVVWGDVRLKCHCCCQMTLCIEM